MNKLGNIYDKKKLFIEPQLLRLIEHINSFKSRVVLANANE